MSLDTLFAMLTSYSGVDNAFQSPPEWDLSSSRVYSIEGVKMAVDFDAPIPIVYGRHIVAPVLINYYVEEGENETLSMLLGVAEGEIESISNIKINGNPIENYYGENANDPYGENAEITVKKGTTAQTPIQGFEDVHSVVTDAYGLPHELAQGVPFEYTTVITNAECFKITFTIDRLYQINDLGNVLSWYVAVKVDYKLHGTATWTTLGVHDFNNTINTPFQRYFKSDYLTAGQYDIRITKLSTNEDDVHFGTIYVQEIDEIYSRNLAYPSTALLGIRLVTAEAVSNVTCVVTGKKVRIPDVRDTEGNRVSWEDYYWDSTASDFKLLSNDSTLDWDGTYYTGWSANPAWCVRDLILATRYGLGNYLTESNLDEASFLAAAKFCDEGVEGLNGKTEKRMRLDLVLDTKRTAPDWIYTICSLFRCSPDFSSNTIRLVIEKAEDECFIFNTSSILQNSFGIDYISDTAIPNVLSVAYTNKDTDYQADVFSLVDKDSLLAGEEFRDQSVQMIGVTRISQILRESRILLNKLKVNVNPITFVTDMGAFTAQKGDVFQFQHDLPGWGEGGRCGSGCTTTSVVLDKSVVLNAGTTYEIKIQHEQTDEIETRTVSTTWGTWSTIEVSTPLTTVPVRHDKWNIYVAGTEKKFRVANIERSVKGTIRVSAVNYDEDAYDYTGIETPTDSFKYIVLDIPLVTNLTVVEQATLLADGTVDDVVLVSYIKPIKSARFIKTAKTFEIFMSDNNGTSWMFIGSTDKDSMTIRQAWEVGRRYTFAVTTVTTEGERTVPATSPQVSITIEGWKKPPAQVSGFTYTFEDEIKFDWEKNSETNIAGYEIRINDDNWGTLDSNLVWRGQTTSYTIVRPSARGGIRYYIRAFNTNAVYSTVSATVTPSNPAPSAPSIILTNLFQKAFIFWDDSTDADLVGYEIWQNDNDVWTGTEVDNEELVAKSQGTSAIVTIDYATTYYRVRAYDKFGTGDFSNVVSAVQITLDGSEIGEGTITTVHISDNAITAPKILAGSIQAGHIAALAITAEKINVACLSAISANLGCITAGTIVGACIKTSNQDYRTELNNSGLYSYNEDGNLTIKLVDGGLCLIDPDDSDFYSYLSAGSLKFHYPYGSVPYVKRLTSGSAEAGDTVCLCQWYEKPEVAVSVKRLLSYNPDACESCQDWCVYADGFEQYDNGGADFGWKFDVHVKLVVSGGTRDECIYLDEFNVTETTDINTCRVLVKGMFQLWCYDTAPSFYQYGKLCYEVRYRCAGCGVWCGYCYSYTQPNSTVLQLTQTNITCHTIEFPCAACWEIELNQISLSYLASSVCASAIACCFCSYEYQVDCSYWTTCVLQYSCSFCLDTGAITQFGPSQGYCKCCALSIQLNWGAWDTTSKPICRTCTYVALTGMTLCMSAGSYSLSECRNAYACNCVRISTPGPRSYYCGIHACYCQPSCSPVYEVYNPTTWNFSCTCGYYVQCVYACLTAEIGIVLPSGYYSSICRNCSFMQGVFNACQIVCYKCCRICTCVCSFWYCVPTGAGQTCVYKKMYSITETTDSECVLDAAGEVNYLAIAYS